MDINKRCGSCGKYPFCRKIEKASQEACEDYTKIKILTIKKKEDTNEQRRDDRIIKKTQGKRSKLKIKI